MTILSLLFIVGPAIAVLAVCASQAIDLYQLASRDIQAGTFLAKTDSVFAALADKLQMIPLLSQLDVKGMALKGISDVSSGLAGQIGALLKNTVVMIIDFLVMLITLFFFFRDGESYYRSVMDMLPFSADHKKSISLKIHDTFSAVVNGVFLIAGLQGLMTGIGFALFRIPFPVFWGMIATILALLPIGGAALVWLPGVFYLYLTGSNIGAFAFCAWGLILVSLPDNFLKPLLIGKKAKLPAFFLFIGILGGIQVYGFLGILFGPLVVTLLFAFFQIYREEYADHS